MGLSKSERFFIDLPPLDSFEQFSLEEIYHPVPSDWYVAITDVRGSTKAVAAGRYKDVNALGAASIVAVLNVLDGLHVPFVFGGDGATLLIPGSRKDVVADAFSGLLTLAREYFDLGLRASLIPVSTLQKAGYQILVARFALSDDVSLALLAGDGITAADAWLKAEPPVEGQIVIEERPGAVVDTTGFECRWQPLESQKGQICTIIAVARGETFAERSATYRRIMDEISRVTGSLDQVSPQRPENLRLSSRIKDYSQEVRIRCRSTLQRLLYTPWIWIETMVGRLLLAMGWTFQGFGPQYFREVVTNSDYRKFDATLRLVLDLTDAQIAAIRAHLDGLLEKSEIFYGVHTSAAALMTCAVFERPGDHVHFIDGADGGYTLAAKQMKAQIKAERESAGDAGPQTG